jgi:putative ABC transport system substrate-binding protein
MQRREFIAFLGGTTVWPVIARAQQPAMPLIGMLHSQTEASEAARIAVIQERLKKVGFVADRNVAIEHRFADGHNERLPMLAAELIQLRVNLIFANTTPPALAAKAATAAIPTVFVTGADPVELGLVSNLNRPGANVTGVTVLSNKLVAKRLQLLCDLIPGNAPIGMLAAENNPNTENDVEDAVAAANALGRALHVVKVTPNGDIGAAVAALIRQHVGALFVAPQADFRMCRQQLFALAERHALPTTFSSSDHVTVGGLMSYGPNQMDSYRDASLYTGRILRGEKPADLPVMQATKFELVINLKTAKALDLTIPPALLALATNVIE